MAAAVAIVSNIEDENGGGGMEREIVAVELALEHLPREYQELFHLRYEREQIWEVIFPMINCSRPTCFRMRDRLVERVDAKLNFLNSRLSLGA